MTFTRRSYEHDVVTLMGRQGRAHRPQRPQVHDHVMSWLCQDGTRRRPNIVKPSLRGHLVNFYVWDGALGQKTNCQTPKLRTWVGWGGS